MPYCGKCGFPLEPEDEFCGSCGAPVGREASHKGVLEAKASPQGAEPSQSQAKVLRCPACGEIVSKGITICPACGFELRDASDGSIAALALKLDEIEACRPSGDMSVKKNVVSATDQRKASLIRSWPVPNNEDDLFEFMSMASSNCIAPPKLGNDRVASEEALADAWRAKLDQAYAKAERLFGTSKEFERFKSIYDDVGKKAIETRARAWAPWVIGISLYLLIFLVLIPLVTHFCMN